MDMGGMDMGGMGMSGTDEVDYGLSPTSNGVPGYFYLQKVHWVIVGSVIAFAMVINIVNRILAFQRLRSSSAKPKFFLWTAYATATAICREITYVSFGSIAIGARRLRFPTLGDATLVLSYLTVVLVLCFYKFNPADQWSWEPIGYRAGCIAQTQLPFVFILAGKQNLVGLVTGVGYERLSWIHRWVSRTVWLTVTLHMAFFFRSWARYDYILIKLKTDDMTQTGFAAWVILTFIMFASLAPIRRWNYEIFVLSHMTLVAGLIYTIFIHVDDGINYIWTCIAIWVLDRFLRTAITIYLNLGIFHWSSKRHPFWANNATMTPLPGNLTRISIPNPTTTWTPGQHMFLSCHGILPLQSHPFTIASLPSDQTMDFLVQSRGKGTSKFHRHATKSQLLLPPTSLPTPTKCALEGPYGRFRPLEQFASVVFFAGSTGATFTTPLMRDIVRRWSSNNDTERCVTTHIRFVWAIKSKAHLSWFRAQLEDALRSVREQQQQPNRALELDITVYITCDEALEPATGPPHGDAAELQLPTRPPSLLVDDEKKALDGADLVVRVNSLASSSLEEKKPACGPNGRCCCKSTVADESAAEAVRCCCSSRTLTSSSSSSSLKNEADSSSSPIRILTGRPHPRSIIRKVLEEAEGESAVVVCGPLGLRDDVRRSVVGLSDERAVHKGTGAQGVYLHVEGFGY